jgi:hypothetical protein
MEKNILVRFDRKFQIWLYSASHGQLLLRSTKTEREVTQIDVLFKNVALIQLPAIFQDLAISEITQEEFLVANLSLGSLSAEGRRYFRLDGHNWRGIVVAGHVSWVDGEEEHSADSKWLSSS